MKIFLAAAAAPMLIAWPAQAQECRSGDLVVTGERPTGENSISTVAVAGVADASSEIFNPGIGRAVYGGLRFKW